VAGEMLELADEVALSILFADLRFVEARSEIAIALCLPKMSSTLLRVVKGVSSRLQVSVASPMNSSLGSRCAGL
jgi:hypothetical protein